MLRTLNPERTLWEAILPEPCLRMPPELEAVDRLLDDRAFFEPYRSHFDPEIGRPSIPIETYLRMMFLKFRHRLGYESLCREVGDSITWSRFCRIPLGASVPNPSTLAKITVRCGEATIDKLNETLLAKAADAKVLRTDKVRADTTVVEANVAYPTDSGLLARGVAKMARAVAGLKAMGLATRTAHRDRTRSMRRRAHSIGAWLRRRSDEAKDEAKAITAEMATIAQAALVEARHVAANAARSLRRQGEAATGAAVSLVAELESTASLIEAVIAQTRTRIGGETPPGATRVVSLHDPDARPIAKGRLGKPVQFGYLAQVVDNADGVVLDHGVMVGNPPDAPLLAPAVARIKALVGRAPRAVAADRGYGQANVEAELRDLGVTTVAIPRKGKPGAARREVEGRRAFRRLVKWRTGAEGRISHLKHGYAMGRTLLDGVSGAQTWCGLGILAHNCVKISGLIDAKNQAAPATQRRRPPLPAAASPPPRRPPDDALFS